MRRAPAPLRLRILAGAALCALVAGAAHAQSEPIRLQADVAEIGPGERLEASGHVQAETGQGTINAERLSRDDAGRMEASGGVEAVVQSTNRRGEPQSRSLRAGQVVSLDGLAPPLLDSEWVLGSPERIIRIVLHGLRGPIVVLGREHTGDMPAFKALEDEQLAAILTYVRREWGHPASPIDAAAVKATRAATTNQTDASSARELVLQVP